MEMPRYVTESEKKLSDWVYLPVLKHNCESLRTKSRDTYSHKLSWYLLTAKVAESGNLQKYVHEATLTDRDPI